MKYLLDLPKEVYDEVIIYLREITYIFDKNKIASIRNRVEHKRDDFPTKDEINKACTALKEIVIGLE